MKCEKCLHRDVYDKGTIEERPVCTNKLAPFRTSELPVDFGCDFGEPIPAPKPTLEERVAKISEMVEGMACCIDELARSHNNPFVVAGSACSSWTKWREGSK